MSIPVLCSAESRLYVSYGLADDYITIEYVMNSCSYQEMTELCTVVLQFATLYHYI